MKNFLKLAVNGNSLKALTKEFNIDELKKFSNNLNIIIEQREEQEAEFKRENREKIRKIESIKSLLAEQGLMVDDLINGPLSKSIQPKKPKVKPSPKYRLIDLEDNVHEWSGRGLPPKVFKEHFNRGHSKESCLIIESITV
jgi:DNA-binding protein H-NS